MSDHSESAAALLKLMANTNRLVILRYLSEQEHNVGELERRMDLSQPVLSQHLARMRGAGVVKARREGQHVFYSISHPAILPLLEVIDDVVPAAERELAAAS
ncbi:MAG: metalloregulator ArsR/SmtB family transcription factor [Alphaproteobacteria bacterium]